MRASFVRLVPLLSLVVLGACLGDDPTKPTPILALPADSVFELRTTVGRTAMELGDSALVRAVLRNRSTSPQTVYLGTCGVLAVPEDVNGAVIGEALEGSFCTQGSPADVTLAAGDSLVTSFTWTHRGASTNPTAYAFLADTLVRFRGYLQSRKATFFAAEQTPLKVTDTKNAGAQADIALSTGVSSTRVKAGDTLTVTVRIANLRSSSRTLTFTSNCAVRAAFRTEDARLSDQVTGCGADLKTITLGAFAVRLVQVKWKAALPSGDAATVPVTVTSYLGVTAPDRVLVGPGTQFLVDR